LDLEPSSDYENLIISKAKKSEMETQLKAIELKNAMFNPVVEDMFFTLD
jgi:hypothetical protein